MELPTLSSSSESRETSVSRVRTWQRFDLSANLDSHWVSAWFCPFQRSVRDDHLAHGSNLCRKPGALAGIWHVTSKRFHGAFRSARNIEGPSIRSSGGQEHDCTPVLRLGIPKVPRSSLGMIARGFGRFDTVQEAFLLANSLNISGVN